MREVCANYVILSPRAYVRSACVVFNETIARVEVERGVEDSTVLTHGLASAHTHLGLYPLRTSLAGLHLDEWVRRYVWPWERLLRREPELSYYTAILALSRMLTGGVTAVADMHFNEDRVARAFTELGVRGDLSVAIMSRGVYDSFEEGLQENIALVNRLRGSALLRVRLGATTPRLLTPSEYKEVIHTAKKLGVGVHTHIAEVPEDIAYLRSTYGMSLAEFIEHVGLTEVNSLVAHGVWLDRDSIARLGGTKVTVVHCPFSNTLLRDGVAPIRELLTSGVRVALGLDVSPTYSMLDEVKVSLSMHLGRGDIDLEELFESATVSGYKALGFGEGIISPGEPADLVLWEVGEPVQDPYLALLAARGVREVYVAGRRVVEEGTVTGVPDSLLREARGELLKHLGSSPARASIGQDD
jgi:5-methylthioadenosine/S-adenosylhomocysteine deaminase